jgi:hypothetical protein
MGDLRLQRETIERSRDNMGKVKGDLSDTGPLWLAELLKVVIDYHG